MPTVPGKYINREGRNEFQLFVAILCGFSGLYQLLTGLVSPAIAQYPLYIEFAWAYGLVIGAAMVLLSAFWGDVAHHRFPVLLELAGLVILGGMFLAYGVTIIWTIDGGASFAGPVSICLALACLSRSARVFRWLTKPREEKLKDEIRNQLMAGVEAQVNELVKTGKPLPVPLLPLPMVVPDAIKEDIIREADEKDGD